MAKRRPAEPPTAATAEELGLEHFSAPADDMGLSLDELSETYAALMGVGEDPYHPAPVAPEDTSPSLDDVADDEDDSLEDDASRVDPGTAISVTEATIDNCELEPRTILEAMLFIGNATNEPLASKYVASLMRGVSPHEIDELVESLNADYEQEQTPYFIESTGTGYRMALRPELTSLREVFYGRVKEAKLSQATIDVLAVVAYNQPLTKNEVEKLRGRPSGAVLSQLVRRELLRVDRPASDPRSLHYYTTDRFLTLFGLESLDELPRTLDAHQ